MSSMLIMKFGKFYTILMLCGNFKKYQKLRKQKIIESESEILREKFSKIVGTVKILYDSGELVLNKMLLERFQNYMMPEKILEAVGAHVKLRRKLNRPKKSKIFGL